MAKKACDCVEKVDAMAEVQKREHTYKNLVVRAIKFIPGCGVYVALYETLVGCSKRLDVRRSHEECRSWLRAFSPKNVSSVRAFRASFNTL